MLSSRNAHVAIRFARAHGARSFSVASGGIKKVGVIGMGQMGNGIIMNVAECGYQVVGLEVNEDVMKTCLGKAKKGVTKAFEAKMTKLFGKGEIGALTYADNEKAAKEAAERISATTNIEDLKDCDLVIESAKEDPAVKKDIFTRLGKVTREDCILASNTSSFSITEMAEWTGRPKQMVGIHFFNPVAKMRLVEVIHTEKSEKDVFDAAFAFASSLKKSAVACKDTPGFIVNRLLVPYLSGALRLVEQEVASKKDVDTAMMLGAGHPMGPITLADYVGLDTTLAILEGWQAKYPDVEEFVPPKLLKDTVAAGRLGAKVGEGFYKWENGRPVTK